MNRRFWIKSIGALACVLGLPIAKKDCLAKSAMSEILSMYYIQDRLTAVVECDDPARYAMDESYREQLHYALSLKLHSYELMAKKELKDGIIACDCNGVPTAGITEEFFNGDNDNWVKLTRWYWMPEKFLTGNSDVQAFRSNPAFA